MPTTIKSCTVYANVGGGSINGHPQNPTNHVNSLVTFLGSNWVFDLMKVLVLKAEHNKMMFLELHSPIYVH